MSSRFTTAFGPVLPIVQAGMSWASSCVELPAAVSDAGGLGVLAAGPLYPGDFKDALRALKAATRKPFAVNVPLYRDGADDILAIVLEEKPPIVIASQGGPARYLPQCKAAGIKCIHVVASVAHAEKAASAGVDGLVVVGGEAGGHPPPDEVSTLVAVRAITRALPDTPVIAGGGIADGYGIAAVLALGADAAQLGTRYLATREARVHPNYKQAVLAAGVADTRLVGRGMAPIRMIANAFSGRFFAAEASAADIAVRKTIFKESSLKMAALDGDVEQGKVEAGQSAGLIDDLPGAGELTLRLAAECRSSLARLAELDVALERGLHGHDEGIF